MSRDCKNIKFREALKIQLNECRPDQGGTNLDDGQCDTKIWDTLLPKPKKDDNMV